MTLQLWSGGESRRIVQRIVVEGRLVLETPARLGNGDTDDLTDMPLLRDPYDEHTPLLTGASLAGALRSYLREREHGYDQEAGQPSFTALLFGGVKGDDNGEQSLLIVDDALGESAADVEVREGVRIHGPTGTAMDDRLFDLHLWKAGTAFPLRLELLVRQDEEDYADRLRLALASALEGLNDGSITLGARKNRGYGQVSVRSWTVTTYNLITPAGLVEWLVAERGWSGFPQGNAASGPDLPRLLGVERSKLVPDQRRFFEVEATLALEASLLIRSTASEEGTGPDMVHLRTRSARNGQLQPVLSGTSLAGTLGARALKIGNALGHGSAAARDLVERMWGTDMDNLEQRRQQDPDFTPQASRLKFREEPLHHVEQDLVQMRVGIDRFTGGARDTALFSQQPAFDNGSSRVAIKMRLSNPEQHEVGLLLLLLKDLWTGDLPLGGEASVGRGRLRGRWARLTWSSGDAAPTQQWELWEEGQRLQITGSDPDELSACVPLLHRHLQEAA